MSAIVRIHDFMGRSQPRARLATRRRQLGDVSRRAAMLDRGVAAELHKDERKASHEDRRKGVGLDGAPDVVGALSLGSFDDLVDLPGVVHDSLLSPHPRASAGATPREEIRINRIVRFAEGATLDSATPWLVAAARGKGDLAFVEWLASRGAATALKDKLGRTGAEQAHEENNTCAAQQGQSPAKIGQKTRVFGKAHYVRRHSKRRAVDFQSCKRFNLIERNRSLEPPSPCVVNAGSSDVPRPAPSGFALRPNCVHSLERNQPTHARNHERPVQYQRSQAFPAVRRRECLGGAHAAPR